LSREKFFKFLDRVPKQGTAEPRLGAGEEAHYVLVDLRGGAFYFEWLEPDTGTWC